ncbi:hypothetical protein BIV57_07625 [Mangrovactinospora gilvigrisea]|uniref:HTH hxlR-type domain-containing protein n=1 Tax=Mangrovactinospora gilvigrisea TaxID=1428644 RepID=A0A1J7C955_9ACTN|nr:hypothetical protein BIV57_07625 [Mangrovactinospora gilvigrisea]
MSIGSLREHLADTNTGTVGSRLHHLRRRGLLVPVQGLTTPVRTTALGDAAAEVEEAVVAAAELLPAPWAGADPINQAESLLERLAYRHVPAILLALAEGPCTVPELADRLARLPDKTVARQADLALGIAWIDRSAPTSRRRYGTRLVLSERGEIATVLLGQLADWAHTHLPPEAPHQATVTAATALSPAVRPAATHSPAPVAPARDADSSHARHR